MEYIQLTDVIFCLNQLTPEILSFDLVDTQIIIDGTNRNVKLYKDNETCVYFKKGTLLGHPWCKVFHSIKIYHNIRRHPQYVNKPDVILMGYGYNIKDKIENRQKIIRFILNNNLMKKDELKLELLKKNSEDAMFIR